jgi:uncharacterized pyridoxamine 5'-phosphate oxidase family protein
MTRGELLSFLRRYRIAVEATVGPDGAPQAAVVGIAVSDELELIFDTLASTRKYANLRTNPRVALVVGWDDGATAQVDGVAHFPEGEELERGREARARALQRLRGRAPALHRVWTGRARALKETRSRGSFRGRCP